MASNKPYLADTWKNANASTIEALYDIANQAGVKNDSNTMSTFDLTEAIKKATGTSGNTYGGTIGNKTLNQYGYKVDKAGNITKIDSTGSTAANGKISAGTALSTIGSLVAQGAKNAKENPALAQTTYQIYNIEKDYNKQLNTLNNGYEQYITQLNSGAGAANAALDKARENALAGIDSVYDDSARNYYRLYRTQENELPEQLSSIGATGGATESAALRLMNNYSDNLYKNETARNQDINGLNENYYNAVANNSKQLAQQIADAYLQQAQQQAALEGDRASAQQALMQNYYTQLQEQKEADAANKAASSVSSWNSNVTDRMAEQLAKGDTIWTWTDDDGKKHWSTYESVGLANGGKKLSPSKKKIDSSGGGKDDDVLLASGYASPKLLTPSAAAGTPYAVAYEDIMSGFTSPNGTWISTSRNPLTRPLGTEAALKSYINSAKKK